MSEAMAPGSDDADRAPADEAGSDALFSQVYRRLKAMAARQLAARPRDTLDTTALVHELYLRMGEHQELSFDEQAKFFAYAARSMRNLLIDRARERLSLRAGGDWVRVTLDAERAQFGLDSAEQALGLEQALRQLEETDARAAKVVELRYFAGLTLEQAAHTLGLARRTVDRDWRFARAFLNAELE